MFEQELKQSVQLLENLKTQGLVSDWILIGGLAVSILGSPRATGDIDFSVKVQEEQVGKLASQLQGKYRAGDTADPLRGMFYQEDSLVSFIRFRDVTEEFLFRSVQEVPFEGIIIRVPAVSSLIGVKILAGSALDLSDARALIELHEIPTEEKQELEKFLKSQGKSLDHL